MNAGSSLYKGFNNYSYTTSYYSKELTVILTHVVHVSRSYRQLVFEHNE